MRAMITWHNQENREVEIWTPLQFVIFSFADCIRQSLMYTQSVSSSKEKSRIYSWLLFILTVISIKRLKLVSTITRSWFVPSDGTVIIIILTMISLNNNNKIIICVLSLCTLLLCRECSCSFLIYCMHCIILLCFKTKIYKSACIHYRS